MKATMTRLFALILTITAIAGQNYANEPAGMTAELQEIMRLSRDPRTKQRAMNELARLRELSPKDARLPYAYALGLIERLDYRGALVQVKEAVRLDPSHLNAWKTRIWLAANNREFNDAMTSMEQLTSLMPAEGASPEVERKCRHFCSFMGSIFGYMEGPQSDAVETLELESSRRRIVDLLPTERRPLFDAGRNQVLAAFKSQLGQIEVTREIARKRAAAFRTTQLEQLDDEHKFVYDELDKLEKLRLEQSKIAAEERSVIAATRERSGGRSVAASGAVYRDKTERDPFYRRPPGAKKGDKYELDHRYDRNRRFARGSGSSSSFGTVKGLGRPEYWNSVAEQRRYNDRMDKREKNLHRRISRIAKERSQLLEKPNLGNSDIVRAAARKATSLRTYASVPIDTKTEAQLLFASYQR